MLKKEDFNYKYGTTQGRLTESNELQRFPSESWQLEFVNAPEVGLSYIELLSEREFNPNNPLWLEEGREEIKNLMKNNNLEPYSIVCDFYINHDLLDDVENNALVHFENLFLAANEIGCSVVVLPLMEKSIINPDNANEFEFVLKSLSAKASKYGLKICLETTLEASSLIKLLDSLKRENIKAVYDVGNRANLDENAFSEISLLGKYLEHVHIKDKDSNGNNVTLGKGIANFQDVFKALKQINYSGPLIFESTRGANPLETTKSNIKFCNYFINKA